MPSRVQGARGRRTRILPVPALCRRDKGAGGETRIITYPRDRRGNDARDGGKLDSSSVTAVMKRLREEEQERRKTNSGSSLTLREED